MKLTTQMVATMGSQTSTAGDQVAPQRRALFFGARLSGLAALPASGGRSGSTAHRLEPRFAAFARPSGFALASRALARRARLAAAAGALPRRRGLA